MTAWLEAILSASMQTSVFLIVLFTLRRLWGHRIRPGWMYAMWLLVLIKLTFPWMPDNPFSVVSAMVRHWPESWSPPAVSLDSIQEHDTGNIVFTDPSGKPADSTGTAAGLFQENGQAPDAAHPYWLLPALPFIWLAGAGLVLMREVLRHFHFRGQIHRNSRPVNNPEILDLFQQCKDQLNLRGSIALRETENLPAPALYGWLRPTVLLPTQSATDIDALKYILLHELSHCKRQDIPVQMWMVAAMALHWFNPLVWMAWSRFRGDQETACDASVLSRLSPGENLAYGSVLLQFAERTNPRGPVLSSATLFHGYFHQIRRRILLIRHYRKPTKLYSFTGIIMFVLLASLALGGNGTLSPGSEQPADSAAADVLNTSEPSTPTQRESAVAADPAEPNADLSEPEEAAASGAPQAFIWPVEGRLVSPFGMRIEHSETEKVFHPGWDLASPEGTPVKATASGTVEKSEWASGYGNLVILRHADGMSSYYAHLKEIKVEEGIVVQQGETIGLVGRTGRALGNMLHFELRKNDQPVDPREYLTLE